MVCDIASCKVTPAPCSSVSGEVPPDEAAGSQCPDKKGDGQEGKVSDWVAGIGVVATASRQQAKNATGQKGRDSRAGDVGSRRKIRRAHRRSPVEARDSQANASSGTKVGRRSDRRPRARSGEKGETTSRIDVSSNGVSGWLGAAARLGKLRHKVDGKGKLAAFAYREIGAP